MDGLNHWPCVIPFRIILIVERSVHEGRYLLASMALSIAHIAEAFLGLEHRWGLGWTIWSELVAVQG